MSFSDREHYWLSRTRGIFNDTEIPLDQMNVEMKKHLA